LEQLDFEAEPDDLPLVMMEGAEIIFFSFRLLQAGQRFFVSSDRTRISVTSPQA